MGDTGQGINVGDAVLTFLGDTTQLDQAFDRVATQAEVKMARAAASIPQIGDALDATGDNAAYAGENFDKLSKRISDGSKKAAQDAKTAGQTIDYSFREARGGIMLLSEELGVHVPRELAMLLAHIPMVGAAFSVMLPLVGVAAAIELIGNLIDKHMRLAEAQRHAAEESETLEIKQHDLKEGLEAANLQLEDQIRKLEGRPTVNNLAIALIATKKAVDDLATSYATDFQKMDKAVETELGLWATLKRDAVELALAFHEVLTLGYETHGETDARLEGDKAEVASLKDLIASQEKLNEARRKLADQDPNKDLNAWKTAVGGVAIAAGNVQKAADAAHAAVKAVKPDAAELLGILTDKATTAKGEWQAMALEITKVGLEARKANQEIANTGAERASGEAKRALDAQLANIETWKAAQHAAYEVGKIDAAAWRVAELQATDAAAIAHESYQQKLVAIYTRAGEVEKAQVAAQQLATLQTKDAAKATDELATAMEHHHTASKKLVEEYAHLIDASVEKEFLATAKAAEQLTKADDELLKAQTKLAEDKLSAHYRDQEEAITKLAAMGLITEQQKNDRLVLLEKQQADQALAILNDQLSKEEAAVRAAAAKIAEMKLSPGVSPAAVIEAEANLKKLETAVTNTEAQIVQTQEKFNKQSEADSKSHYGRSLLMAISYGNELLAEQLKENHAQLLAAQQELRLAKARGEDTTAIQQKITALKQHEQVLEKEASGSKKVIDAQLQLTKVQLLASQAVLADAKDRGLDSTAIEKQIAELKKLEQELNKSKNSTGQLGTAMEKLKQDLKDAAKEMLASLSTAFEGIITGQQSFGKAMEEATFKMIGKMAMSWGEYFAAKGIADILFDPPLGGAELAASAALFAISGVMSGLASNAGQSGSSGHPNQNPAGLNPTQTSASGGGSNQTVQVPKLAAGGIVSKPTTIMAGDSKSGGAAEEAILPLSDPAAMSRIASAILQHLTGFPEKDQKPGFQFAEQSTAAASGFQFSGSTAPGEKRTFASGTPTVGEALGFTSAAPSVSEKAVFSPGGRSAASEKAGFTFSPQTPTLHEAAGFTSGEPSPGEKSAFTSAQPSESQKAEFLASQPSVSEKPGFNRGSPTVGEALGFKFDTPYPGDKPVFSSGQPSAPEKPGFALAQPSAREQRDFAAASPSTVGEALGFSFSSPRASYEGLGFTSGQPSTSAKPGFSSGVQSPHEKPELNIAQPSAGERPGFSFTAPSLPREMPDMASLAAHFGGLLSQPTLRAASDAQAPMAAVSASSAGTPIDIEARMEKFAARLGGQMQPEGASSSGNAGGDTTHIHVNVKGMISPDNLNKVVRTINRKVQNRQLSLNASNSLRVTKRSQ